MWGGSWVRDNTANDMGVKLRTLFLASLRARLSLLFLRSSITRRSYGARLSKCPKSVMVPQIASPMSASVDVVSNYSMFAHDCNCHGDCGRLFRKKYVAQIECSTYPETSRMTSLTNAVRRLKCPFLLEIFVLGW